MLKSIKKKADALWAKIVRNRNYCELCGASNVRFNAHHIISRANHSLRYDLKNGINLCVSCHFHVHQDPTEIVEWLKDHRGQQYKHLLKEKRKTNQLKMYDYEEIYNKLKESQ